MGNTTINQEQGHWLLAKMGKKILRPGGRALTRKMIQELKIRSTDEVVEFAPGLGFTAQLTLAHHPQSYVGIELNQEAAAQLKNKFKGANRAIINNSAAQTGLPSLSKDKVYGEAMLTMQADHRKAEIIREAARILKPGGYYGIHELSLTPDDLPEADKAEIQKGMAKAIKVNARPLTQKEWASLLENEGFEIISVHTNSMDLLKTKRVLADEGLFRSLKIGFNVLTHPHERKRILGMKNTFRKYENHLNAVALIARKK